MSPGLLWAAAVTAGTRTDPAVTEEPLVDLLMTETTDLTGEVRQRLFTEEGQILTFSPQEPPSPKRKPWLAGTEAEQEEQEEPPPASGDQEEEQQQEEQEEEEEESFVIIV